MTPKSSIRKKISSLIIKISLSSIVIFGILSLASMLALRENTIIISKNLGDMASIDSQRALLDISLQQLFSLAENKAALSDAELSRLQNAVEMIANQASNILQNSERYVVKNVDPPNAANAGVLTAQLLWGEGLGIESLDGETALLGNIQDLLLNIVESNFGNPPGMTAYIGTESGFFIAVDAASDQAPDYFDPRERPWYQLAIQNNALSWTDVFVDAYGMGLAIVSAMPFHREDGSIAGVAGIGNILDNLIEIIIGTYVGETGYAFVMNEHGQIIMSPNIIKEPDGDIIREDWLNSTNQDLVNVAQLMVDGQYGIERITIDGADFFIAYAPFEVLPWSFATVIEVSEVIAPAIAIGENILEMTNYALYDINRVIRGAAIIFILILLAMMLAIGYTSRRFSSSLTRPIISLKDGVSQISDGNLDYSIDIFTGDEIEDLGMSVNKMASDLKDYISNLQKVTADKERIGAELNIATQIQASMLPCIFPAFPGRLEFDIYAMMIPAKEVGGDFYDFFLVEDNKLAMVMADVSGKGVPAALFMVIAKTLIKNNAQMGKTPKEIFETVNDLLCENNDAGMFVTVFMGILDISTGKFSYVNAGHNPPLIKRAGGDFEWLPTKPGFVIAGMEGMSYQQDEITLHEGDTIYMYTDGVTEAVNLCDELFTELKLLETANKYKDARLKNFLENIKSEVDLFANGADQADDITMLIMKMTGGAI